MRKAEFKIYEQTGNDRDWVVRTGDFHGWGVTSTEFEGGGVTDSVAIMETEDGQIYTPFAVNVKFLK